MRDLRDYSAADWLHARPLVHGFKRARNLFIDHGYRSVRPRRLGRFLADNADLGSGTLAVAIAFNEPWVIDLLTIAARNLVGARLIILDNSRRRAPRMAIAELCRARNVPYLALPPNPERHGSRSHGIALNWAYYNVVRRLRPKVFAFIDHDLFPMEPTDLAALVRDQPVYGFARRNGSAWYLWAGYAVFNLAAVENYRLDFNTDIPRGLDTGGRNWTALYRHLDASQFRFATAKPARLPGDSEARAMRLDGFLHVGGSSGERRSFDDADRARFRRLIKPKAGVA